jgi:putative heme-binding domain-containing protein
MVRIAIMVWVTAAALPAQIDPDYVVPTENPHNSPADLKRGEQLFLGHCGGCHGPKGEGGRGPYLARPKLPRAPDDRALFELVRDGIPGTEMPAGWVMISKEIWQVAGFVRTLGRVTEEKVPGNAANGERLYRSTGNCAQCHSVQGQGGTLGPELSAIGSRRSASYLREALLEPQNTAPEGFMQVRLVTRDGRRITGVRLNEDTFTVQVRDLQGMHSFQKQDLQEFQKEPGKTPMPSYRGLLSPAELDDIVAYLVSLRGGS